MKLFEHQIGRHQIRCPYEEPETVENLFRQFVPNVLFHVFKIKNFDPKTSDLPTINGIGFKFGETILTVYADGTQLLFLDKEGVEELARKVPVEPT